MEVTLQDPPIHETSQQNGVAASDSAPSPMLSEQKFLVSGTISFTIYEILLLPILQVLVILYYFNFFSFLPLPVEVCLNPSSTARIDDVRFSVTRYAVF